MPNDNKLKPQQVWVKGDIHKWIKVAAANTGIPAQDLIDSIMRKQMEKDQKKKEAVAK